MIISSVVNEFDSDSFEAFRLKVNNLITGHTPQHMLLMVVIKNYEQISALLSQEDLVIYDDFIKEKIICKFKENWPQSDIFTCKKYFYCLVPCIKIIELDQISYDLHRFFLNESYHSAFADTRFIGIPLKKPLVFEDYIKLISDQMYYLGGSQIIYWIEDGEIASKQLTKDYEAIEHLRIAINQQTACFAFQPIVNSRTGETSYYECLLRLNDFDYQLISAGRNIYLAEKYGFISIIDETVIAMAIKELAAAEDVKLSVNISNIGVQDALLLNKITNLLTEYKVGSRLIVEITETSLNENFIQTLKFIEKVKSFGCKIALDDFGTGYTSYNQLSLLPLDIIKIDGSLIREIANCHKYKFLVENLIKTAEEIGCKTVAEFVENGETAKMLIEMKVDYLQGNFLSPALNYRNWDKV